MLPSKLALRMTVLLSFLLSAAMPVGSQASSTPVLDRIRDTGIVRLAHRESAIPFSYYYVDKQPIGYALDLCQRVVDKLRTDLKRPDALPDGDAVDPHDCH